MARTRVQVWTFLTTYVFLYHPSFFLRINPHFKSFKHRKHAIPPMSLVVDITRDVLTKSDASLSKNEFTQAPWVNVRTFRCSMLQPFHFDLCRCHRFISLLPRTNTHIRCALLFKIARTSVQLCPKYFFEWKSEIIPDHLNVQVLRVAEDRLHFAGSPLMIPSATESLWSPSLFKLDSPGIVDWLYS